MLQFTITIIIIVSRAILQLKLDKTHKYENPIKQQFSSGTISLEHSILLTMNSFKMYFWVWALLVIITMALISASRDYSNEIGMVCSFDKSLVFKCYCLR